MAADITLYFSPASRSFTPRWLLEELGVPYRVVVVDIRTGVQRTPEYLRINSMGKVPAPTDGEVVVSENPAICLYLADRYSYGEMAPSIEARERGPYLRWIVFSTAVFEPAVFLGEFPERNQWGCGWGTLDRVVASVESALAVGPWLLGERFSAADVMLGSLTSIARFAGRLPNSPLMEAYVDRLAGRPAYKAAATATWPPNSRGGTESG